MRASRFLGHATNGATRADIDLVVDIGIDAWLDAQFLMDRTISHWDWMVASGYSDVSYRGLTSPWDYSIWRQLIEAEDQLRQRVALAMLDIFVVSIADLVKRWPSFQMGFYMDVLLDHAFGNFRDLLSKITRTRAMGDFLTYVGSAKENGTGEMPDENYAREIMQLFTLGLYQLNQDGTYVVDANGAYLSTYSEVDVTQLARVFTGFEVDTSLAAMDIELARADLVIDPTLNETGSATFLGSTVSGGGYAAVEAALDIIFAHPNVPPFFAKAMIRALVTSNPTPAYVARVADVFVDNGAGVRGDIKAVVRSVLTDAEALSDDNLELASFGRVRAPVQRFTNWARSFNASPANDLWQVPTLESRSQHLGQSPGHAPSVFNFFQPDYAPKHSSTSNAGLVAPEFQIADEVTAIVYVNFMLKVVSEGLASGLVGDYSDLEALAADPVALVDEIALRLAAGQLSQETLEAIRSAIASISETAVDYAQTRIKAAMIMVLVSPEYLIQR
ncbi:DUF1800 domain-containing protein [Novosphingobium profundi]|uniref:DUF1800 domain-containing protein n=1 Tax=Novosphingobium profundi TaxID=1774954 RepID=UPI001BD97D8D|nr:DUF1800 domain-containing protein [Novosphingobium profundi]MBT0668293.1 DUF1800 domain-containing protein [Novosphingobium profundi]